MPEKNIFNALSPKIMMAIHFIALTFKHNNQNAVLDSNPFMVN